MPVRLLVRRDLDLAIPRAPPLPQHSKMKTVISSTLAFAALRAVDAAAIPDVSGTLQNILQNTHGSDLYTYPTDLTRGILPVSAIQ